MRKTSLGILGLLFLASSTHAAPGAIRCGKLLDVRSGRILTDQVVLFDDAGTIKAIGPAASTPLPSGVKALDLSAATCLPGLIDVHTHLTGEPGDSGEVEGLHAARERSGGGGADCLDGAGIVKK